MPVEVQLASRSTDIPQHADIERWARAALAEADSHSADAELCVRVVDAEESRALNERYRGKNKATNVLSFPADVDLPDERLLGDIVICAPVVASEAADQGKTVADHYAHMVVHGVLHLMGYDHGQHEDAERMEALEIRILERCGVSDPYQTP